MDIAVAVVAGLFSVVVALIHLLRRDNRRDHADVSRALGRIEGKLDAHVEDHRRHS